jgi:hypothetical protein
MPDPMIPLGRFRREVQQYIPTEVVLKCMATSRFLDDSNKTLHQQAFADSVSGFSITRYAQVTHHGLAAVVKTAIRDYRWAGSKPLSIKDVMALASNWNNVEDPYLGSGLMTLIRVAYEQFPYQEQLGHLIPRYQRILTETKPPNPSLDVPAAFLSKSGLSIEEFMKIGFAFYSASIRFTSFCRGHFEATT